MPVHEAPAGRTGEHDGRTADVCRAGQEAGKRQASDVAVPGGNPETVGIDAGAGSVDLNTRCADISRLRRAVDHDWIRDPGQQRAERDDLRPGTRNREAHLVDPRACVGGDDRLSQRSGTAVRGAGHCQCTSTGCTIHDGGDIVDERLRALEPVGDHELGFAVVREVAGRNASWGVAGSLRLGRGKGARASAVQDGDGTLGRVRGRDVDVSVVVDVGSGEAERTCRERMTGACAQRSCSSPAQDDDRLTVIADGCIGGDCHIQDPVLVEVRQRQSIGTVRWRPQFRRAQWERCRRT